MLVCLNTNTAGIQIVVVIVLTFKLAIFVSEIGLKFQEKSETICRTLSNYLKNETNSIRGVPLTVDVTFLLAFFMQIKRMSLNCIFCIFYAVFLRCAMT